MKGPRSSKPAAIRRRGSGARQLARAVVSADLNGKAGTIAPTESGAMAVRIEGRGGAAAAGLGGDGRRLHRQGAADRRQRLPLILDTDDAMRLTEVRDFLAGQNWFDLVQHRLNTPYGGLIHWSRLIDLPEAVVVGLLRLPFGAWATRSRPMSGRCCCSCRCSG